MEDTRHPLFHHHAAALFIAATLGLGTSDAAAEGQGCFLRSQQTFGMTTTCIYDCFGREMRTTISSSRICPLTTGDAGAGAANPAQPEPATSPASPGQTAAPPAAQPGTVQPGTVQPGMMPPTALPTTPQGPGQRP